MTELKKLFARVLDINEQDVTEETSRENTEKWDSFNHLLLINELEKEFNIRFTMEEVEKIKTFKDIKKIVTEKGVEDE